MYVFLSQQTQVTVCTSNKLVAFALSCCWHTCLLTEALRVGSLLPPVLHFYKCFIWQLQLIENKGEMNWGYLGKNYCFFLQPSAKEQGITRVVALVHFFLHFLIKRLWSGNNFSASKL